MPDNPYASSHLPADAVGGRPPGIRVMAIVVGFLVDLGFSLVSGLLLGVAIGIWLVNQGVPPGQLEDQMNQMPLPVWGGFVLGCIGSVLGGYFAAAYAKVWPLRHALLTGVVSLALGMISLPILLATSSLLYVLLSFGVVLPLTLLGGYLYSLRAGPQQSLA